MHALRVIFRKISAVQISQGHHEYTTDETHQQAGVTNKTAHLQILPLRVVIDERPDDKRGYPHCDGHSKIRPANNT